MRMGPSGGTRSDRRLFLSLAGTATAGALLRDTLPGIPELAAAETTRSEVRNAIIVVLGGGASQLDTWDYKPDAPSEIRGPYAPIKTKTGDAVFGELCPALASINDRFALIRSGTTFEAGSHLGGYENWLKANGEHYVTTLGRKAPEIPYVNMVGPWVFPLMEAEHRNRMELHQALRFEWDKDRGEVVMQSLQGTHDVSPTRLSERLDLRKSLDSLPAYSEPMGRKHDFDEKAESLLRGSSLKRMRAIWQSPRKHVDEFGDNPYGGMFEAAARMADPDEGNTRLVVIETGEFDHHLDLEERLTSVMPSVDQALAALITRYGDRLVIAARGEFGRTPRFQGTSLFKPGRDHFPIHSEILAGPTIEPQTYGSTTRKGDSLVDESFEVTNRAFAHTFLRATGDIPADSRNRDESISGLVR